jgi:hypothetical protein
MTEPKKLPTDHLMHCSRSNLLEAARRKMPEKLIQCMTGSRLTFSV